MYEELGKSVCWESCWGCFYWGYDEFHDKWRHSHLFNFGFYYRKTLVGVMVKGYYFGVSWG